MFTIIFPVLNERLRLESGVTRTVEYLRKIAFEDYEIIIVDNGSEDETPQIAEMLCQKYEKVRYERATVTWWDIWTLTCLPISNIWERQSIFLKHSLRSNTLTAAVSPENPIQREENGIAGSRPRDC